MPSTGPLNRTALYQAHLSLEARMVPFGGWEMPLQYPAGILAEARAVRSRAGIFDVSHMGRIRVTGEDARALLHRVLTRDVLGLASGRTRYTLLCTEDGGILDDGMVSGVGPERLLLVCNAASRLQVWSWLQRWAQGFNHAQLQDTTEATAMVALQGPESPAILDSLAPGLSHSLRPFGIVETQVADTHALVGRTGFTGEDGFEVVVEAQHGERLWRLLLDSGAAPCGLGARDILRLEAGFPLYGADIDSSTSPSEAGLERFVDLEKGEFLGGDALRDVCARDVRRKLVGLVMPDRSVPRSGYALLVDGQKAGHITSGGYSPALDKGIGLGYVAVEHTQPGASLVVDMRGRRVQAEVVRLPFYARKRQP